MKLLGDIQPGTRVLIDGVERTVEWKIDDVVVCAATARGPYYTRWSTEVAQVIAPEDGRA